MVASESPAGFCGLDGSRLVTPAAEPAEDPEDGGRRTDDGARRTVLSSVFCPLSSLRAPLPRGLPISDGWGNVPAPALGVIPDRKVVARPDCISGLRGGLRGTEPNRSEGLLVPEFRGLGLKLGAGDRLGGATNERGLGAGDGATDGRDGVAGIDLLGRNGLPNALLRVWEPSDWLGNEREGLPIALLRGMLGADRA
jgi:hypothetical protein